MNVPEFLSAGRKVQKVYGEFCRELCRRYEINQTCFDVMMFLANNPGYNTARDLCTIRGLKSGNVSVAIENLMRRGFLISVEDPSDRRVNRLSLTEKAGQLVEEGKKIQMNFFLNMTKGVSKEELMIHRKVSEKLAENVRNLEKGEQKA